MDPRTRYLSAFRGQRAPVDTIVPPSIPSPVGAQTSATVQAQALSRQPTLFDSLPKEGREELQAAYSRGGFDSVRTIPGWYDLPEYVRTQLLSGLNRIEP